MQGCSCGKENTMRRDIDMDQISDGKRYTANDMVRIGCDDCSGCSDCCRGMGSSILLDPYDAYRLMKGLGCSFDAMLSGDQGSPLIGLDLADGLILPHLQMAGKDEVCSFLNEEGRCRIHEIRPGFCRLFPLGRIYEDGLFRYFHQIHECSKGGKTKVKISKWLGIPNLKQYETFVLDWHDFLEEAGAEARQKQDPESIKQLGMGLLYVFYRKPYDMEQDFYEQFYARLAQVWERQK